MAIIRVEIKEAIKRAVLAINFRRVQFVTQKGKASIFIGELLIKLFNRVFFHR